MVEFSIKTLHGTIDTLAMSAICPHCGYKFAFFYKCPSYCVECEEKLPNVISLMRIPDDKLAYHKTGKTINVRREL